MCEVHAWHGHKIFCRRDEFRVEARGVRGLPCYPGTSFTKPKSSMLN